MYAFYLSWNCTDEFCDFFPAQSAFKKGWGNENRYDDHSDRKYFADSIVWDRFSIFYPNINRVPKFIITQQQNGQRIDRVLVDLLSLSRSQIQKQIVSGTITINNKTAKPHTFLKTDDCISVSFPSSTTSIASIPFPPILYEDTDVLVINKPAGLIVHGRQTADASSSLADMLLDTRPKIAVIGDDPSRPGIVHRLDKDVSGLMVIAKTQTMFENLKQQFKSRTVKKTYLALVYGVLPRDNGTIAFPIARSKSLGHMVARTTAQDGKEAITCYDVLARYKTATYIRVTIKTGRTHQIRVHMRAIDHPVVGDRLYKKTSMRHIKIIELGRLFLHAHELTFHLANGEEKTFVSPLPEELERVLSSLPTK